MTSFEPFEQLEAVSDLLAKWLDDAPVTSAERYLRSAFSDTRRRLNADTGQVDDVLVPVRTPQHPTWLPDGIVLPPCEAELLFWLFSRRRISVITSGTGSGKTSSLTFLWSFLRHLTEGDAPPLRRNNLIVISIQSLNPQAYYDDLREASDPLQVAQKFLLDVARELDTRLLDRLGNDLLLACFGSLFLRDREDAHHFEDSRISSQRIRSLAGNLRTVLRQVRTATITDWGTLLAEQIPLAQSEDLASHRAGITPHELLEIRFFTLYEACMRLGSPPTAVVIDNVDNFPEYLQRKLIDSLKTIAAERFHDSIGVSVDPPLTLSIFARLSTAATHANSFGELLQMRAFSSPDPADIVFLRLAKCLEGIREDEDYRKLPEHDQVSLLSRAWYFWRCLAVQSPVRKILSARAGSNIRNALWYVRTWLLSRRIVHCPLVEPSYEERIADVLAGAVLLHRVQSGVQNVVSQRFERGAADENEPQVACDLFCALLKALDYAGRFTLAGSKTYFEDEDFRGRLWNFHDSRLESLLGEERFAEVRSICRQLIVSCLRASLPAGLSSVAIRDGFAEAENRYKREVRQVGTGQTSLSLALVTDSLPQQGLLRHDMEVDRRQFFARYHPYTENAFRSLLESAPDLHGQGNRLQLREDLPSRWLSASVLIAPDDPLTRSRTDAVNLLSATGIAVLEIPLVIVAILQERARVETYTALLRRELDQRGFSDQTRVLEALRMLVKLKHRLIYAGVRDDRDGVERWWSRDDQEVHLSCAGSRYLCELTRFPAYIQWALFEVDEIRAVLDIDEHWYRVSRAVERMEKAREAFAFLLGRERGIAEGRGDRRTIFKDGLRMSAMPITWCFFNCLPAFIDDLVANRHVGPEASSCARGWIELAQGAAHDYMRLFGTTLPTDWEVSAAFAKYEVDKMQ